MERGGLTSQCLGDELGYDVDDPENCPGCGCPPGDGPRVGCLHPGGCGHYWDVLLQMAGDFECRRRDGVFADSVMRRLRVPDEVDAAIIRADLPRLRREGYTVVEAVDWCRCLQEVNPELDEDVALARMSGIAAKVSKRMKS